MLQSNLYISFYIYFHLLLSLSEGVIYTYEDVELRRLFPNEFPMDTIRRSGSPFAEVTRFPCTIPYIIDYPYQADIFDSELLPFPDQLNMFGKMSRMEFLNLLTYSHLGRYAELKSYFKYPKNNLNSHFEEMICYKNGAKKVCKVDVDRYLPEENNYYTSSNIESHVDRRRVYCFMLLCFTEDELDRVVASF